MAKEQDWWTLDAKFLCRVERRPSSFKDYTVLEKIARGEISCPFKGREEEIQSPKPTDNVAGRVAAKKFPEACPLCDKTPDWSDFRID